MKQVLGGVCAAKGFSASGVHCGIRKNKSKKDLALITSAVRASAAAVYTQNLVKGAPLLVTRENLADGMAQAIICNSGNANTCNAGGVEVAQQMCTLLAQQTGVAAQDVVVASTGVIGQPLDLTPIAKGIPPLAKALAADGAHAASEAIQTTDTIQKQTAVEFELGGVVCHIGGMAKGSGMIHPNMATMLCFVTSDVAISPALLQQALSQDVQSSFNMVSVDGDTSTNDMVCILANGLAGNEPITKDGPDYQQFCKALHTVTVDLCRKIAKDGEGASRLLQCTVTGAGDAQQAKTVAKAVITSSLLKAAMFGADANWGRVLCAVGYSGAQVDVEKVDVQFASAAGSIAVCKGGAGVPFSEKTAKHILKQDEIDILISLGDGPEQATAWGCDLTYDYVKINGDYRT